MQRAIPFTLLLALALPSALRAAEDGAADERYQYVARLYEKEMYELAAREARAFLREHPRHPRAALARYRLASALFELERPAEAAPEFRALAEAADFEHRAEAWLRLGQCELELGRVAEAELALCRAHASGEEHLALPAAFLLGEAAFRRGDHDAAAERYAEVLARAPRGPHAALALRGEAWCELRRGRHARAAERARAFLAAHPESELAAEMRLVAGEAELGAGRPREALSAFRSIEGGPLLDAALRGAGFALSALGELEPAAAAFGELFARFPDGRYAAEAALQQGAHLVRAGRAAEALAPLSSPAAGAGPELAYWRARAEAESGDVERALGTLDRALAARPPAKEVARLCALRGDLAFQLGRLDEAARDYERSGSDYALHAGAVAHLNAGRHEAAARLARELVARHPESPYRARAQLALGEALFALGRHGEALSVLAPLAGAGAADGVSPTERARAHSRVAWCRYLQGEKAEAAALFAGLVARHPQAEEAGEAQYMEGRARVESGDEKGAREALAAFVARGGEGERRAEALLLLARLEDDAARLETLLAEHPASAQAGAALLELARRHEAAGRREEAIASYRELGRREPEGALAAGARYGLAYCLHESGRPAEALAELELLLAAPLEGELWLAALELCVWAARSAGNIDRCVSAYRSFGSECRDEARAFRAAQIAARALEAGGRADEAQRLLGELAHGARELAVKQAARIERCLTLLRQGAAEAAEGELDAAIAAARQGAPAGAALAEAAFACGEALFERGENARADALYETAATIAESPLALEARYKQGFARLFDGDPGRAALAFGALVEHGRDSELWGESLFLLGEALFRAGRHAEAAAALERLRREMPRHETLPKALFRLGLARVELGEWKRASECLSELARKHPGFEQRAEAELARGRALVRLDDPRGARAAFERAIAIDQGAIAARARLELGRLHRAANRLDEALSEFLKVALLYAHAAEVAEALYESGVCLELSGEAELARRQYEELLREHPDSARAKEARERLREL